MKICSKCKFEKSLENFSIRGINRTSECKSCVSFRSNEHYKRNRQKCNEKRKKHYEDNKESTLAKSKEYYEKNRDVIRKRANEQNKTPERREKARIRSLEWCKKNKEKHQNNSTNWKRKNPLKSKAHQYVLWAIRLGVLKKPDECRVCRKKIKLEGHHDDYNKPLEVKWLCRLCHMHIHEKLLDISPGVKDGNTSGFNSNCD